MDTARQRHDRSMIQEPANTSSQATVQEVPLKSEGAAKFATGDSLSKQVVIAATLLAALGLTYCFVVWG